MGNKGSYHKGNIPWNKDKINCYSKETLKKMSQSGKRKIFSLQHCENISKALKGIPKSKEHNKKNSKSHKGKPSGMLGKHPSIETRKKNSEALKGAKCYNWQGGISFEPYSIEFNKGLKELIRNRDSYKCQLCGILESKTKLSIHHIDYNKKNCLIGNLITLCRGCNTRVNSNKNYWEIRFKK